MHSEYAELQVTSNFSFLRGASHPEEYIDQAVKLGIKALAVTDRNSLAGIVRAHSQAKIAGLNYIVGARVELRFEAEIPEYPAPQILSTLIYPTDRDSYGRLCTLLTIGNRRCKKGECLLTPKDLFQYRKNLIVALVSPCCEAVCSNLSLFNFERIVAQFKQEIVESDSLFVTISRNYQPNSARDTEAIVQIARVHNLPLLATNNVYYHTPQRRPLQDVITSIREHCAVSEAGFKLLGNTERHLKSPAEMSRLFADLPEAITNTTFVAERCKGFSLEQLRYEYPNEICPEGRDETEYLRELTFRGARERYKTGVPQKIRDLIEDELRLISELQYEKYFLTCYDIVQFAKEQGVLCQGRGAAANSAVCFMLGITAVDPDKIDTLFARFVSKERNEPPDIDIDFEHERREEVIQYIYQKYGRHRAGLTSEVITYRHRSATREVAKALGYPLDLADKLAKLTHRWSHYSLDPSEVRKLGINPTDLRLKNSVNLINQLLGFPRHLSQHVGGFIISERPLCETVPILNAGMEERTIIEWDKDDIEILGMLKIDILGLGMLSCIRKALDFVNQKRAASVEERLELYSLPPEDRATYEMICRADTIGVFQIESRAQMSMLPRLKPKCFYDLVIEVAIVRPGPIQGKMVHPFLRRRDGIETISFPDKRVEEILGKTLGVPLFQEQAMRLAIVLAKFSPGEAEQLRRSMAAWKRNKGLIEKFEARIVKGMTTNGYTEDFAKNCVSQIKGFSEYGFPESHAASFALLVYASAWLKCHHPLEFAAALLNSQPMGFYQPAQILACAKNHGVKVLPIDILHSDWDCKPEGGAVRLGFRLVKGISKAQIEILCKHREKLLSADYSVSNLWKVIGGAGKVRKFTLLILARADAFNSFGLSRREAIWEIRRLASDVLPLDPVLNDQITGPVILPKQSLQLSMFDDYRSTGFSLKAHPISFYREWLNSKMASTARELRDRELSKVSYVSIAGVVIVRQKPPTAKGFTFITIEDETGIVNLVIKPDVFQQFLKLFIQAELLFVQGKLERSGDVVYVNVLSAQELSTVHG